MESHKKATRRVAFFFRWIHRFVPFYIGFFVKIGVIRGLSLFLCLQQIGNYITG